ncbi:MAG: ABC transporter ATP-binding protein [Christensenellales bacterium]
MIQVRDLSKHYGPYRALDSLSFHVPKGQVVGLLGQNGAGKTTLMNLLAGYLPFDAGLIRIGGVDMAREPLKARALIGCLPEVPPLYQEMTVREYLSFCCAIKGVRWREQIKHIEEISHLTGIRDVVQRRIGNLSKGFKQRVGLAQALCGDPKVLLLDEPSNGFDPGQAVEFRAMIKALSKSHTILLSSHLLSEVQTICDRVLILHQGRILYDHVQEDDAHRCPLRYRLRARLPRQDLLKGLLSLPSVLRASPFSQSGSFDEVMVEAKPGGSFESDLLTLLAGVQAPILALVPMEDSVEDTFMRLTAQGSGQESVS